ncbi:iron chaperone [Arthrobacter sp. NA-172]|uniref:iron chaperone n=1 Tax=Arthrobacter sp. NA-172 TaxID=3367524 RepID=UPI003753FFB4
MAEHFETVDDYIAAQPDEVQTILREIRRRAYAAVPGAGQTISYGIPTITFDGHSVVYFAAWKHHISVYPAPGGDEEFERGIAPYRASKGTLKFPLGKPIPYELIEKVASLLAEREQRWYLD